MESKDKAHGSPTGGTSGGALRGSTAEQCAADPSSGCRERSSSQTRLSFYDCGQQVWLAETHERGAQPAQQEMLPHKAAFLTVHLNQKPGWDNSHKSAFGATERAGNIYICSPTSSRHRCHCIQACTASTCCLHMWFSGVLVLYTRTLYSDKNRKLMKNVFLHHNALLGWAFRKGFGLHLLHFQS